MLQSQSERVSVGLHLVHQELVFSTDGQSTCAADPRRPLPISGMGLESLQWGQETAGVGSCHGDCGRMREQEEQNGSVSLWRRKGAAGRVSHSRGVEVSWSLRQDGLEGLWCKQGMVGREGGRGRSGLEDWCAD